MFSLLILITKSMDVFPYPSFQLVFEVICCLCIFYTFWYHVVQFRSNVGETCTLFSWFFRGTIQFPRTGCGVRELGPFLTIPDSPSVVNTWLENCLTLITKNEFAKMKPIPEPVIRETRIASPFCICI